MGHSQFNGRPGIFEIIVTAHNKYFGSGQFRVYHPGQGKAIHEGSSEKREEASRRQDMALHFFLRRSGYILFGWNVNCYGVLIKGGLAELPDLMGKAVAHIEKSCEPALSSWSAW